MQKNLFVAVFAVFIVLIKFSFFRTKPLRLSVYQSIANSLLVGAPHSLGENPKGKRNQGSECFHDLSDNSYGLPKF